ncbi:transposase [Nitrosomonas mobilis]|uniref:Transposase n=1 Tax=Nitrosomonas mobilis TaxID=51642 RepID=A0A1G5SBW6_9PROT
MLFDFILLQVIRRFGSAANLNIHLHCLVLDDVYHVQNSATEFHGALIEEEGMTCLAEMGTDAALAPLQSATGRVSPKAQPHSFPCHARAQREASF